MGKFLPKVIPFIFWLILVCVILQVPYPDSLAQADFIQILSFFIPLFLAIIFTLNLFLKKISISLSVSLGLIFLLILKALDSLNLVTAVLILISIYLLISYFMKNKQVGLTNLPKISKLSSLRRRK